MLESHFGHEARARLNSVSDAGGAVVLQGMLASYRKIRANGEFLLSEADRQAVGLTAIASALAGSGGAIGLAGMMGGKEQADKVEFELGGKQVSGWLMWSPFKEGDQVEVVAEPLRDGTYRGFAILRPADRLIALYPHCSRGMAAHYRASLRWLFKIYMPVYLVFVILSLIVARNSSLDMGDWIEMLGGGGLFGLFIYSVIALRISRRFTPFVRLAGEIFKALGWKDPREIDLPARSRKQSKADDLPGLGTLYFRY